MFPPQQQTPPTPPPPPPTGQQVGQGYAMLQKLVQESAKRQAQAQAQGAAAPGTTSAQPPPPPIRTDSIGGLLQSLHDRLSYAIFGAPDPKTTASNGAGGGL